MALNASDQDDGWESAFPGQNCTNITQDNFSLFHIPIDPSGLSVPLYGYAMPILMVVTLIANSFIIVVLWQKHMRTPSNILLLGMALCDMLTVVFPSPLYYYMYARGNYDQPVSPPALCFVWDALHEYVPCIFHTASVWLTVLLAGQRYIYVCHAPVARAWCTLPRVTTCITIILTCAAAHQLPSFFAFEYDEIKCVWRENGGPESTCIKKQSLIFTGIEHLYYPIYFLFRVFFVHLGPCVAIVVLNALLFRALQKAQRKRKRLLQENKKKESLKVRDANLTTLMLIVVSTVVLITELPLAYITSLHILTVLEVVNFFSPEDYDGMLLSFFVLSNSFIIFSYPINFPIYFGMSRQFRKTFRDMFVGRPLSRRFTSSVMSQRASTQDTLL